MMKQVDFDELQKLAEVGKQALEAQKNPTVAAPETERPAAVVDNTPKPPKLVEIAVRPELKKRPTSITLYSNATYPLLDNFGNPIQHYELAKDVQKFDVNKVGDKSIVENAKNEGAFYKDKGPSIALYSIRSVAEIEDEIIRVGGQKLKAGGVIDRLDTARKRSDFARLLGITTDFVSESTVLAKLIELAEKAPADIIKQWEKPDREERVILRRAIERKVVNQKNGIYYYGEEIMGENFEKALLWMQNNPDIGSIIEYNSETV